MGTAFQVVSVIFIIGAVLLFRKKNHGNDLITKTQRIMAVFQIVLCGAFFALCLSDVLDLRTNFSPVRLFLNVFYALSFLSLTVFALTDMRQIGLKHLQMILCFCAALIAAQCFVFPYDADSEFIRICEAFEGIAVFTMLIVLATRISDKRYGESALLVIVILEFAVAVLNTRFPMDTIAEDIQIIDIPMNYMSLYMRPVIFSSLALIYRVWLDLNAKNES